MILKKVREIFKYQHSTDTGYNLKSSHDMFFLANLYIDTAMVSGLAAYNEGVIRYRM